MILIPIVLGLYTFGLIGFAIVCIIHDKIVLSKDNRKDNKSDE